MGFEVWKEVVIRFGLCILDRGGSKFKVLVFREFSFFSGGMRGDMRCFGIRKESIYFYLKMFEWYKRFVDIV